MTIIQNFNLNNKVELSTQSINNSSFITPNQLDNKNTLTISQQQALFSTVIGALIIVGIFIFAAIYSWLIKTFTEQEQKDNMDDLFINTNKVKSEYITFGRGGFYYEHNKFFPEASFDDTKIFENKVFSLDLDENNYKTTNEVEEKQDEMKSNENKLNDFSVLRDIQLLQERENIAIESLSISHNDYHDENNSSFENEHSV